VVDSIAKKPRLQCFDPIVLFNVIIRDAIAREAEHERNTREKHIVLFKDEHLYHDYHGRVQAKQNTHREKGHHVTLHHNEVERQHGIYSVLEIISDKGVDDGHSNV
jgi:hypothetical protein